MWLYHVISQLVEELPRLSWYITPTAPQTRPSHAVRVLLSSSRASVWFFPSLTLQPVKNMATSPNKYQ